MLGDILFILLIVILSIVALAMLVNLAVYIYVIVKGHKVRKITQYELEKELKKHFGGRN